MPFSKGENTNRANRPNRTTREIREAILSIISANTEQVKIDIKGLKPEQRVRVFSDLCKIVLPKVTEGNIAEHTEHIFTVNLTNENE